MMKKTALIFSLLLLALPLVASEERVASPDGRLVVTVSDNGGKPAYSVAYDGVAFLAPSPLGLKADIGDFTAGLALHHLPGERERHRVPLYDLSGQARHESVRHRG